SAPRPPSPTAIASNPMSILRMRVGSVTPRGLLTTRQFQKSPTRHRGPPSFVLCPRDHAEESVGEGVLAGAGATADEDARRCSDRVDELSGVDTDKISRAT